MVLTVFVCRWPMGSDLTLMALLDKFINGHLGEGWRILRRFALLSQNIQGSFPICIPYFLYSLTILFVWNFQDLFVCRFVKSKTPFSILLLSVVKLQLNIWFSLFPQMFCFQKLQEVDKKDTFFFPCSRLLIVRFPNISTFTFSHESELAKFYNPLLFCFILQPFPGSQRVKMSFPITNACIAIRCQWRKP